MNLQVEIQRDSFLMTSLEVWENLPEAPVTTGVSKLWLELSTYHGETRNLCIYIYIIMYWAQHFFAIWVGKKQKSKWHPTWTELWTPNFAGDQHLATGSKHVPIGASLVPFARLGERCRCLWALGPPGSQDGNRQDNRTWTHGSPSCRTRLWRMVRALHRWNCEWISCPRRWMQFWRSWGVGERRSKVPNSKNVFKIL